MFFGLRNTFTELITLDMGEVMDPEIVLKSPQGSSKHRQLQFFTEFVVRRIEKAIKPLSDVIQRSNLFTFTTNHLQI